jgi:hypothetical protein
VTLQNPTYTTVIAGVVFVAGLVLTFTVSPFFILLAASGAFLPDLFRLLDLSADADEFQEQAAGRASRVALVVSAGFVGLMYALTAAGRIEPEMQKDAWLISFTTLVTARYIAYATMYWDPYRAAPRVFLSFGAFWLAFVTFSEWGRWGSLLIEAAVVVGPFVLASIFVARFPRIIGALSIGLSVAAFFFFDLYRLFLGDMGSFIVFVLISTPLLVTGIGLVSARKENQSAEHGEAD